MTNAMIIELNKIELVKQGVLKYTGKKIKVFNVATQQEETIDEIQSIHTYQAWKSLGFQVKKGEKAVAKFPIWKHINAKSEANDEQTEEGHGKMFMKLSAFFTEAQVEKMEGK